MRIMCDMWSQQRQKYYCNFKAIQVYIVSSKPARATCVKKNVKKQQQ